MRWIATLVVGSSLVSIAGCSEYNLRLASPRLELSDDAFRWDGAVVRRDERATIVVSNRGRGNLLVEEPALADGTSDRFRLLAPETLVVRPSESIDLTVQFEAELPGRYTGRLDLVTNDPERPVVELPLDAAAMEPTIQVDPAAIGIGFVTPETTAERSVRIEAGGVGTLEVYDFVFDQPHLEDAFVLLFPGSPPFEIGAGRTLEGTVLFRPPDTRRYEGRVEIVSNAVNPEDGVLWLGGNGDTDPEVNAPPQVEIRSPLDGDQALAGRTVRIVAATFDEEDPPESLLAELRVDGVLTDTATPDSLGVVQLRGATGPSDASSYVVTVVDTEGETGSDSVTIDILDPDELLTFVISGGPDPSQPFAVDDDLVIQVDGRTVFEDTNTSRDVHGPVTFEASPSSEIRLVATDHQYCTSVLDGLTLHALLGVQQRLNPRQCRSACSDDPCFDPAYQGPWPNVFFDRTYPIVIGD